MERVTYHGLTMPKRLCDHVRFALRWCVCLAALWLSACGDASAPTAAPTPEPTPAPPPAPTTAATPATAEPTLVKGERKMMGTIVIITTADAEPNVARPAIEAALDEMQRLERLLSEWDPDSEISRINKNAGSAVQVSGETLAVIQAGLDVSRWSEGAYDISWAALREHYTFKADQPRAPNMQAITRRLPLVNYRLIEVDSRAQTVKLGREGMVIGTGSIAKGYALDRASEVLQRRGISNFMIFGGGQVQLGGMKGQRAWRVGIQHPRKDDYFGFVEATDVSVSTSGDYEHAFIADGRRWHHIVDLKTGLPVEHTASVTLLSQSGMYADAVSTAVFVLGAERALAKLADAPGRPEVVIVDSELRLHVSPGMQQRLILRTPLVGDRLP